MLKQNCAVDLNPGESNPLTIMLKSSDSDEQHSDERDPLKIYNDDAPDDYAEDQDRDEQDSLNNYNDDRQDDYEEQSLSPMANDDQDYDSTDNAGRPIVTLSSTDPELLVMCRPVSIKIIRLPDSIVNKFIAVTKPKVTKRRSQFTWKTGYVGRKRKNLNKKRLRQKARVLETLKLAVGEVGENDVEDSKPDEKPILPTESQSFEPNEIHKTEKSIESKKITDEQRESSKLSEILSTVDTKIPETIQHEPHQLNIPELSDEIEIHSTTNNFRLSDEIKIHTTTKNVQISDEIEIHSTTNNFQLSDEIEIHSTTKNVQLSDETEIHSTTKIPRISINSESTLPNVNSVVTVEQNNNLNSEMVLQRLLERTSLTISPVKIRKRLYDSDDAKNDENHENSSKKIKCHESPETPEENLATIERTTGEPTENFVPTPETHGIKKINKSTWNFVPRRSKPIVNNIFNEPRVVLCRIEDSPDPLAQMWRVKITLQGLRDVTVTERTSGTTNNRLTLDYDSESEAVVAGVPLTCLEDPSTVPDVDKQFDKSQETFTESSHEHQADSTMEEETEAKMDLEPDEDDDDDEIVTFFRDRRKVRPMIDSSSSTNSSPCPITNATRSSHHKTPLIDSSSPERIIEAVSTDSTSSDDETANNRRRRRPGTRSSVSRRRIISESSSSSESACSGQQTRRSPSQRRKAFQIAMEASTIEEFITSGDSCSYTIEESSNSSFSCSGHKTEESPKSNEDEAKVTTEPGDDSKSRVSNFVTCGSNQKDDSSTDSATESNRGIDQTENPNSNNHDEDLMARRRLTALKNAMVVLTRLGNLDDDCEDASREDGDEEFRIARELEFPDNTSSALRDPLDIDRNDDQNVHPAVDHPAELFNGQSLKVSPKKSPAKKVAGPKTISRSLASKANLEDATLTTGSNADMIQAGKVALESKESEFGTVSSNTVVTNDNEPTDELNREVAYTMQLPTIISVRSLADDPIEHANGDDWSNAIVHENGEQSKPDSASNLKSNKANKVARQKSPKKRATEKTPKPAKEPKTILNPKNVACKGGYICTTCHSLYPSLDRLKKHRISCVSDETPPQNSTLEATNDPQTAPSQTVVTAQSSNSPTTTKKDNPKKLPKTQRSKNRSRVNHLICGVCSIDCATTQALADHIFTHSTDELQKAYRSAKARAGQPEDTVATISTLETRDDAIATCDILPKEPLPKTNDAAVVPINSIAQTETPQTSISDKTVTADSFAVKPATICSCHNDKISSTTEKADLQIEMVLLCQHCNVVYRRRECFEIHYRASPQCAIDRTRGRLPKLYCANCQSTLNSWSGMRRHLELHASLNVEGTVRFVCNICRVVFVGFGALFYNHWSSHLRDAMLVASRYSFPKNAVQSLDSMPKLPIGAAPNETYILVAEHVCTNCKKPFSTRRDLEIHERTKSCNSSEDNAAKHKERENQWFCDVCDISFPERRGLNHHSRMRHGQRYLCVAVSPAFRAFMCTRCFSMKKMVHEMEEHWKEQPDHDSPLSFIERETSSARARALEKSDDVGDATAKGRKPQNSNQAAPANQLKAVKPVGKSKTMSSTMIIDITDDDQSGGVSATLEKTPQQQTVSVANSAPTNSSSTIPGESVAKTGNSVLRNFLDKIPSNNPDSNEKTKTRALEDPCVKVVLSKVSKQKVSYHIALMNNPPKDVPTTVRLATVGNVNSEKKTVSEKSPPGKPSVAVGKTGSKEQILSPNVVTTVESEGSIANQSIATVVTSKVPSSQNKSAKTNSPRENTVIRSPQSSRSIILEEKENSTLAEISPIKPTNAAVCPEIIDIADDKEDPDGKPTASRAKANKPATAVNEKTVKTYAGHKSAGSKSSTKVTTTVVPTLKTNSSIDSATPNTLNSPSRKDIRSSQYSFEELRLAYITRSKQLPTVNSATAKKPCFLRVKNLSELQAVKTHTCHTCNASFESHASLEEHRQIHLCSLINKDASCPKGMTAALVLPQNSDVAANKSLPEVYATGNIVTQQLIGFDPGTAVISGVPVSNMTMNNEATGSWIAVGNQPNSLSSVAVVNTTHSLSGGALLMNLGGQQTVNPNASAIMSTSISTSSATIAHTQEIYGMQQHYLPQQPVLTVMNQQLRENCNGPFRYDVPPATVLPQQPSPMDRQQCNPSTDKISINGQTNNASFTYNAEKSNRYICNICTTFSCNSVSAMNSHVMKHYTGFNNTTTNQNSGQSRTGSNTSVIGKPNSGSQTVQPVGKEVRTNVTGDVAGNAVFLKNTPQGMVWVTSLATVPTQQTASSVGSNNNNNQSAALLNSSSDPLADSNSTINGIQSVYRCLICKSVMYKTYQSLRNHVIVVHGLTNFSAVNNVVQKFYLCAYCPPGATYDTEESARQHVQSCHTVSYNVCFICGQGFGDGMTLKSHMAYCSAGGRDNSNASGINRSGKL